VRLGGSHLTYCTNIHPGESWNEVSANLERYLPRVKRRVSSNAAFGVGLRLSAVAARSLGAPDTWARFVEFLRANGLYVFTINGFPYGPFHGTPVKESVYLPDWRDEARLEYTNALADLLAALLPADAGVGSVSTVPGAFKPNADNEDAVARIAYQLIRHVAHLVRLERDTGRTILLALEPEPCCLLETVAETVAFFEGHLYTNAAATALAARAGCTSHEAERALRRHLGVCLDVCHAAVEFEDPAECLGALERAGIPIGKMQVTAGLRIPRVTADAAAALQSLAEPVYLHQVVERAPAALRRYVDIDAACAAERWRSGDCEWRVHFHVPVFLEQLGAFLSTQPFVREMLALHRRRPRTRHLEVETYTWSVLPAPIRDVPIEEAIARELLWVRDELL
jgi:sugar phosphate isomerase/epimerase